jgi:hypothetical protein
MARRRRTPTMRESYPGYPDDLLPQGVPPDAWEVALKETYRFLKNQYLYKYDLTTLLATVYLQGCLDGAQVQAQRPMPGQEGVKECLPMTPLSGKAAASFVGG